MKTSRFFGALLGLLALAGTAGAQQGGAQRPIDKLQYPKLHEIRTPSVVRDTLPNGIKLMMVEDQELPQISFRALVRGGEIAEPADRAGLADLFGEVQRTGGTATMNGDQIDELLDRLGASVESDVSEAYGTVSGQTLIENVDKVLPVFVQVLTAPAFAQDKIDLAKTHMRSAISRRNDNVMAIAQRELRKLVYGPQSPYARQMEYEDVDRLTRDDLLAFHRAYYRPDATILAVWGDFKAPEMKAKLAQAFAAWKASGPAPRIAVPAVTAPQPSINYIEKKDVEQTFILAAQLGMRLDDPDYPAVYVLSDILGGGFASRIFVKVRTEKGLAYSAGGRVIPAFDHPGTFYFTTSTKPSTTSEALATVLDEIQKIRQTPVTDEELSRAKDSYLNGYAFEYDSTAKIVNRLASYEFYSYPADFNAKLRNAIEKVTKQDVLRAAQKHLDPAALTILAIGRKDQFDKPLDTFGKVNTLDITIPEPKPKEAVAAATPESLTRGKALMAMAAKVIGENALKGLKDITTEGTTTINAPTGQMELKGKSLFVLPNRLHSELATPMGSMTRVVDGDTGWMAMGPQARDLPASAVGEMRRALFTTAGCALLVREVIEGKLQAQALGSTQFEGAPAEDVLVPVGDAPIHVYLSPQSSEVLGVKQMTRTQEGPAETIDVYGARQLVSGLRVPFESTQKVKGEVRASSKLSSVKINAGFSEDVFKKPAAPATP